VTGPRSRRRVLASIAVAVLIVFAGLEGVLRQFPSLMPRQWQIRYGEIQGSRVFTVVRDAELGFLNPVSESSDEHGFANRRPWPERAAIVVLGDSLFGGAGVGLEGTCTELVNQMLGRPAVVNLGIAGAGLERQALIYRRYRDRLKPQLVVAGLFLASDFDNDLQFRGWQREGHGADYNEFRTAYWRKVTGRPEYVDPVTLFTSLRWGALAQKSRLYLRIEDLLTPRRGIDRHQFPDGTEVVLDGEKISFAAAPAQPDDVRVEALMEAVTRLRSEVKGDEAELLIMLIPSKEELFGVSAEARAHNVVAQARRRIIEAGVPLLDLYPVMQQAGALQAPYFAEDIHLNAYGNRVVAEALVAWWNAHHDDRILE
jgi:hypothetical protein